LLPCALCCAAQLPVLRSVQRVLDELAFGMNNCQAVGTPARLIMEQVGAAACPAGCAARQAKGAYSWRAAAHLPA
jgi:hypothetical protein